MKLYVGLTLGLAAIAMANKSGKAKKQAAPIIPPFRKIANMNKKNLLKTSEKVQKKLTKKFNSGKAVAASYGLKFDGDSISKSFDNILQTKYMEAINEFEQAQPKIQAKANKFSLENNARAAKFNAKVADVTNSRQSLGATKLTDLKDAQQKKAQNKINEIENPDVKEIVNSLFGSVSAGLNKNFKEKVPASLNVEQVGSKLFDFFKKQALNSKFAKEQSAEFEKAKRKISLKCKTFNGGVRQCQKAIADLEANANAWSQKAGFNKLLAWAKAEAAKFQIQA